MTRRTTTQPDPTDWSTLAGRLEWIIRERGFGSDRRLGEAAGLSKAYVSMLKSGTRGKKTLSDSVAKSLAAAARVPVEWLKSGEGSPDGRRGDAGATAAESASVPRDLLDRLRKTGHKDHRAAQAVILLRDWLLPSAAEAVLLEPPHDDWSIDQWLELARELNLRAKSLQAEIGERPSQRLMVATRLQS